MDKLHSSIVFGSNSSDEWYDSIYTYIEAQNCNPVYGSVIGSAIVGLSGLVPLFLPLHDPQNAESSKIVGGDTLKLLLGFAIGGLLGDVFLHLLPEAWSLSKDSASSADPPMSCGAWVLAGLLFFVVVEKLCQTFKIEEIDEKAAVTLENNNVDVDSKTKGLHKEVSGYLNLMANFIDNFTHGMAVGGSFLFSWRVGILTTLAILIHEVPHEVGDFAILLRAGFTRNEAAKAQLATATSSVIGATAAVLYNTQFLVEKTSWIIPFSAGGFLHIALVSLLPELVQEECPRQSAKQMGSLIVGIAIMAVLTRILEG